MENVLEKLENKAIEQIECFLKAQELNNDDMLFIARAKYYTYVDAIAIVTGETESKVHSTLLDMARQQREKEDVERWFDYGGSFKVEEQIKYNIAMATEEMLNCFYDDDSLEPKPYKEWVSQVYDMTMVIKRSPFVNLSKFKAKGKGYVMEQVEFFLHNYMDVQDFIK